LAKVARSYFAQESVDEIIFVIDEGTDDTEAVVSAIGADFPDVTLKFIRNPARLGASMSRNVGIKQARNDYILFCDDDEYLEPGYAATCLRKLKDLNAGAVSGRRVYMRAGETPEQAVARFGNGLRRTAPFNFLLCEYVNGAIFEGDIEMPFTNAIILTTKANLDRYGFDGYYARGNGYREETDYQMALSLDGHPIYATNECHSIHLPMTEVRSGGQRVQSFRRVYWSIYYTAYFYGKYYARYARKYGLKYPKAVALAAFAGFSTYREFIRPKLYPVALWAVSALRSRQRGVALSTGSGD